MYSVQIETSDGTLSVINVGIEYFEKDDITLYRNDAETPLTLGVDWAWASDTSITLLLGAEPAGNKILLYRNTDKDRAFNIYDGNAPFSRETLDENFRQMIFLAQEFTEGSGIAGLYRNLDMHGNRIINLATPVEPSDAVTKGYADDYNTIQDGRISSIENTFVVGTNSVPWQTITTTSTDTFSPPYEFTKAGLYINGLCQAPDYSYIVVNNTIMTAEPIPAGSLVFARLGEDIDNTTEFITSTQFNALVARVLELETAQDMGNIT